MASHHHRRGCCHPFTATTSTVCCCCPSYSYATQCHNLPPPDPHLLHHHHHPSTQPHLHSAFPNLPYATQGFHQKSTQCYHSLPADFQREDYFQELHHHQQDGVSHAQPVISSLLRRIAVLESCLRHHATRSQSLREAAARTIQTHFRAFLVRRSRTLRQLKDLASIKSAINVLKSSASDSNHLDPLALSHKALHLLLKLDCIQGDDPMIRDGKKSINRDLTRFLDFIDGVTVKRSELSSGFIIKNARQGGSNKKSKDLYTNQKKNNTSSRDLGRDKRLEDLVDRIEALYHKVPRQEDGEEDEEIVNPRISLTGKNGLPQSRKGGFRKGPDGIQVKAKKNVKFSEDGNVYYVPKNRNGVVLIEDCDSDDGTDLLDAKRKLDILRREAEEVGGISFKDTEDDEVAQSDDGDDQVSTKSSNDGEKSPIYSAPLPARMETRSDSMDKRQTLKIIE